MLIQLDASLQLNNTNHDRSYTPQSVTMVINIHLPGYFKIYNYDYFSPFLELYITILNRQTILLNVLFIDGFIYANKHLSKKK